MIVNNTYRFIFVHVPKAAGTSVTEYLSLLSRYNDLEVGGTKLGEALQTPFRQRFGLSKHSTAAEIRKVVGESVWTSYFTFGFVRNPYERAYSSFNFLRYMWDKHQTKSAEAPAKMKDFSQFVRSDYFQTPGMDRILSPQLFWLRAGPQSEELGVNYVGRVEDMDGSMREIVKRLGDVRTAEGGVPALNRSPTEASAVWEIMKSDPALEEIIFKRYAVDFRIFGYQRAKQKP